MERSTTLVLTMLLALPGCDRKEAKPSDATAKRESTAKADAKDAKETKETKADAEAPEPEPEPEPEAKPADAPPEGWTRLELSTVVPTFTGTVDVPPGVTSIATEHQEMDADGLEVQGRGVRLGPDGGSGLKLEPMPTIPPRFASAEAMLEFHANFEHVSTKEFGPGHWAVVQQWRPGECMLHGWSAAAGLECDVFKAPCDQMEQWVQVCGTLRAGPKPNEALTTPKTAFPSLPEPAAEVAIDVARAVARNDAAMLTGTVGPEGVTIGKTSYSAEELTAALTGKTVLQVVAPIFHEIGAPPEQLFAWNAGEVDEDEASVWFSSGYGEQPFFALKKTGEAWHLVAFGVQDLGEP